MTPSSPDPLREAIREGVKGLISRGEWRENIGQHGAPRWRATVARSEVYYVIDHALAAQPAPAPGLEATEALPEDAPITFDRRSLYAEGWADRGDAIRATLTAQARPPADEGLRAAVAAYVAWQYRQRGAPRFTLTDLRAALAAQPAPAPGLDVADLESIRLALGHFPTWFTETEAKIEVLAASLRESAP